MVYWYDDCLFLIKLVFVMIGEKCVFYLLVWFMISIGGLVGFCLYIVFIVMVWGGNNIIVGECW